MHSQNFFTSRYLCKSLVTGFMFCLALMLSTGSMRGQQAGMLSNGEAKIYYESFGEGDPILIINGGPGMNSRGFRSIGKLLSKGYRTIIYDQRGTGNSVLPEVTSETITMDLMIEDIEALRRHLQVESWVVFGHSFGGMLASYYAANYPHSIKGMILSASGGLDLDLMSYAGENINARLSETNRANLEKWRRKIHGGDTSYYARLQRGKALAPAYLYNKEHRAIIAERLTQSNHIINGLVFEDLQRINYDCKKSLKEFQKPVLIIQGKQDIILERTAVTAHNTFPDSELILLDNCGHYGWLDTKDEYLAAVYSFLGKL